MIDITKFEKFYRKIHAEKESFRLFGLLLRAEAPGKWDLVVSAPWLEQGKLKALEEFIEKMSAVVGEHEVLQLSRVITLNHDEPALIEILRQVHKVEETTELRDINIAGMEISHAVIFAANPQFILEPVVA